MSQSQKWRHHVLPVRQSEREIIPSNVKCCITHLSSCRNVPTGISVTTGRLNENPTYDGLMR